MTAILTSWVVMALHWLCSVIAPGLLGELLWLQHQRRASTTQSSAVRVLILGLIYLMVQALAVVSVIALLNVPPWTMVALKYTLDFLVFLVLVGWYRSAAIALAMRLARALAEPWSLALAVIAGVHGFYVMLHCPYTLDSEMVRWTCDFIAGDANLIANRQGSPMFLGLIYFPSYLLSSWYPVATVTAAMKPMLCVIAALAVSRLAHVLPLRYAGLSAIVGYCVLVSCHYGFYGLFMTGKQSVFGITFMALMVAELCDDNNLDNWPQRIGLALAAALGLGSITLPYSLVILTAFALLAAPRMQPLALSFWLLLCSCLSLAVCVGAVTQKPMPKIVLFILIAGGTCALLHNIAWPNWYRKLVAQPWFRVVPLLAIAISVVVLNQLMPVKYAISHAPLDGQTTFFEFLMHYDWAIRWPIVMFGFIGVVAALLLPDFVRKPGLQAFAMFPFLALVPTLLVAHMPKSVVPFRPHHVWDLTKDVPNWCYGFYFAVFLMVAIELGVRICRYLETLCLRRFALRSSWLNLGGAGALAAVVACGWMGWKNQQWYSENWPVYYCDIGGHNEAVFVAIVERFVQPDYLQEEQLWRRDGRPQVHATPRCGLRSSAYTHYGLYVTNGAIDPADAAGWEMMQILAPACVIARRDEWDEAMQLHKRAFTVTEVDRLTPELSVFAVRRAEEPMLRLSNLATPAVR